MKTRSKKELWLLDETDAREWIQLVLKVNKGYELDEKELLKLGNGLQILDSTHLPTDIRSLVNNANKYFKINNGLKEVQNG